MANTIVSVSQASNIKIKVPSTPPPAVIVALNQGPQGLPGSPGSPGLPGTPGAPGAPGEVSVAALNLAIQAAKSAFQSSLSVFDVHAYGNAATGTGGDDTQAWQAAIDAADAAGGGIVAGRRNTTYVLSYSGSQPGFPGNTAGTRYCLRVPSNVEIDGRGCKLRLANNAKACLIINANSSSVTDTNISVRNLIIDGNRANQTHISGIDQASLFFFGVTDLRLQNIIIREVKDRGLRLYGVRDAFINNLILDGSDGDAWAFGVGSSGGVVYELVDSYIGFVHSKNVRGLHGEEAPGNGFVGAMINCHVGYIFDQNNAAGIKIMDTTQDVTIGSVRFKGGAYGSGNSGFKLQGRTDLGMIPKRVSVGEVVVTDAFGIGLYLENCDDCSIASYSGDGNSMGGLQLPDAWIGAGNRNAIGHITSRGAGVSGVYVRYNAKDFQANSITVVDPGTPGSVLAGNGYGLLLEGGCSLQTGHVRVMDTRTTPVMQYGIRAYAGAQGVITSAVVSGATVEAVVLPSSGLTIMNSSAASTTVYNCRDFGAKALGADDRAAIQAALDAAGAAGGGEVFLPPGTYYCGRGLAVPSNVHFYGAGAASILRYPAGSLTGTVLSGVSTNAAIAAVGVQNARITDLHVDLRTNATLGNGIQFGEFGAAVRSSGGGVERCTVNGHDNHVYLIYVKEADGLKIKDNLCIGTLTGYPASDVTGIEIFGTNNTEVSGNRIAGCQDGIPIKSENKTGSVVPDSYIRNVDVHDNTLDRCKNGIGVSVAKNTDAGGAVINCDGANITVHGNICSNMQNRGIVIGIDAYGLAANISILDNQTSECAGGGIVIDSDPLAVASDLLIQGNTVIQTGGTGSGVSIIDCAAASMIDNLVSGSPYYGVSISNSSVNMIGNVITGSQRDGIYLSGTTADCVILGNSILGYGASVAANGIKAGNNTVTRVSAVDNFFRYGAASSASYAIDFQIATDCQISDNKIAWTTQSAVFVNGTGGRNNYGTAIWDRNANRLGMIVPREFGCGLSNTDILTDYLDCGGNSMRIRASKTPASATDTGVTGRICWDANYVYVCVGTNTWKRAALGSW